MGIVGVDFPFDLGDFLDIFRFHVNFPGFTQLSVMFFSYMRFGCCEISWRMVDC